MNKTIFFTYSYTGHNLEYLRHFLDICQKKTDTTFVFVVPFQLKNKLQECEAYYLHNVVWDYLTESEQTRYKGRGIWRFQYEITKLLRKKMLMHKARKCFCVFLGALSPFGFLFLPRDTKISGIIYDIYLYYEKQLSIKALLKEKILLWGLVICKQIKSVFVLNDEKSAKEFNRIFRTDKFMRIPDPFPISENLIKSDFRKENKIESNKIIFAHFGSLSERKGTMVILASIAALPKEKKQKYVFVFAGHISDDIREKFYNSVSKLSEVKIIVRDEFCSDAYLASLCVACNAIVIPYKNAYRSSGLLGYASQYNKPVIGPDKGLISDLIHKNKLGLVVNIEDFREIITAYEQVENNEVAFPSTDYCKQNSVKGFCGIVEESIG